jgi:hypothetical protein
MGQVNASPCAPERAARLNAEVRNSSSLFPQPLFILDQAVAFFKAKDCQAALEKYQAAIAADHAT